MAWGEFWTVLDFEEDDEEVKHLVSLEALFIVSRMILILAQGQMMVLACFDEPSILQKVICLF